MTAFLSTYLEYFSRFLVHLLQILNLSYWIGFLFPPTLNAFLGFLSNYTLEYLIGFLVHLTWPLNQVSCLSTLNTELGFLFAYYDYWTGFPVFLLTYLVHELSFLSTYFEPAFHLPWILNKVSCPPALKTGSDFLSTYLEYWSTLLVHLLWFLNCLSCPPTLNIIPGFLSTYEPKFSVHLPWYWTWFSVYLSRVLIQVSCRPTWILNHVSYSPIFASEPSNLGYWTRLPVLTTFGLSRTWKKRPDQNFTLYISRFISEECKTITVLDFSENILAG